VTGADVLRAVRSYRLAALGVGLLVILFSASMVAEYVLPYAADEIDLEHRRMGPSVRTGHLLGTDELGRDYLVRVLVGIRSSAVVALTVLLVSTAIGACVGLLSGYWSGPVDKVLMRVTDGVLTVPGLALLLAVVGLVGSGSPLRLGLIIAVLGWPLLARAVRAQASSLRERDFVYAARAFGASNMRIIVRHILPHSVGLIVVHATVVVPAAILAEASLSFLGFGMQPPTPTLGGLIAESRSSMLTDWWLVVFPGLAIATLCLAVNLVGEGIRGAVEAGGS
jgi:peptide/nickel transport system permease protein